MKTQTKLPKRFKEKWVKALRSGKYQQGEYVLYDKEKQNFCCIGVAELVNGNKLCNIKDVGFLENEKSKLPTIFFTEDKGGTSEITNKLMHFNDNGKSFNWIASYIERYL